MSAKDILLMIFDKLDNTIKSDVYFKKLKDIALKETRGNFVIFQVEKRIYDMLNENLKKFFEVAESKEDILTYSLKTNDGIIYFAIKNIDNNLLIELKMDLKDKTKGTVYVKSDNLVRIETVEITKNNGFYKDYQSAIYYYDNAYNEIATNTDEEQDVIFSEEFGIPLSFARFFRLNFKKYAKDISRYVAKRNMEGLDNLLEEKDFYEFLTPFYLDDFQGFINREFSKDYTLIYSEMDREDVSLEICNNEFETIINNLKAQIGIDGEVIISSNIYQNLILILLGVIADGISTKGVIIKKVGNIYTLYMVHITNHEVMVIPKDITQEEMEDIYRLNPENDNIEGLAEFFRINRGRN